MEEDCKMSRMTSFCNPAICAEASQMCLDATKEIAFATFFCASLRKRFGMEVDYGVVQKQLHAQSDGYAY